MRGVAVVVITAGAQVLEERADRVVEVTVGRLPVLALQILAVAVVGRMTVLRGVMEVPVLSLFVMPTATPQQHPPRGRQP